MKKILVIINIVCATLHLIFQIDMNENQEGFYGFVLVENVMVTFSFILIAYLVSTSNKHPKFLIINLLFWLTFETSVLTIKPTVTTLLPYKNYLPIIEDWIILSLFGGMGIAFTCIAIFSQKNVKYMTNKQRF